MTAPIDFVLRGEHITLDALLKATGLAGSGGEAKNFITGGAVQVNGEPELRRGRKLRAGDVVVMGGLSVQVQAGPGPGAAPVPSAT
jgi:ribosome-associated protein